MAVMPRNMSQSGFTFIEIMVVIVILGVIAGSASQYLTFSPTRYEVEKATDAAMLQLNQLRKQSVFHAIPYGMVVSDRALEFRRYNQEEQVWGEYIFSIDNELADIIQYDIEVQRSNIIRNSRRDPDVVFLGDGSYTAFELHVSSDDEAYQYTLIGDGMAAITKQ